MMLFRSVGTILVSIAALAATSECPANEFENFCQFKCACRDCNVTVTGTCEACLPGGLPCTFRMTNTSVFNKTSNSLTVSLNPRPSLLYALNASLNISLEETIQLVAGNASATAVCSQNECSGTLHGLVAGKKYRVSSILISHSSRFDPKLTIPLSSTSVMMRCENPDNVSLSVNASLMSRNDSLVSVQLSWQSKGRRCAVERPYDVQFWTKDEPQWTNWTENTTRLQIDNLRGHRQYVFRVRAVEADEGGFPYVGGWNETKYGTPESRPSTAPTNMSVVKNATAIRVAWKPPSDDQWNGVPRGYHLTLIDGEDKSQRSSETNETHFVFSNLTPYWNYTVEVRLLNEYSRNHNLTRNPACQWNEATDATAPASVSNVTVTSVDTHSANVSWRGLSSRALHGERRGYRVFLWAIDSSRERNTTFFEWNVSSSPFSIPPVLKPGTLYQVNVSAINHFAVGADASTKFSTPSQPDPSSRHMLIVAASAAVIAVMTVVVIAAIAVRRRKKKQGQAPFPAAELSTLPAIDSDEPVITRYQSRQKEYRELGLDGRDSLLEETDSKPSAVQLYENIAASLSHKMTAEELRRLLSSKLGRGKIGSEFKVLPKGNDREAASAGSRRENIPKNRFNNIRPYDFNRIVLKEQPAVSGSDYINASIIQVPRYYIAAQAPLDWTVNDFWRMLVQKKVKFVVNLTKHLIEDGKEACSRYWPDELAAEKFGNVTVKAAAKRDSGDFYELTMSYFDDELKVDDEVTMIHFVGWSARKSPEISSVLKLRRRIREIAKPRDVVVVHCSAGAGRTGTLIALDILLDEGAQTKSVDILGCVSRLRMIRPIMVQSKCQYLFLHRCVLEGLTTTDEPDYDQVRPDNKQCVLLYENSRE